VTPEGEIKKSICDYLAYRKDMRFWVQESQGTYDAKTKRFRKKNSKYQINGVPDIIIQYKYSNLPAFFIGLEVKSKTGSLTDSQKKFSDVSKDFGSLYFVVRSVEDAINSINIATKQISEEISKLIDSKYLQK